VVGSAAPYGENSIVAAYPRLLGSPEGYPTIDFLLQPKTTNAETREMLWWAVPHPTAKTQ